jgi:hypothetical protein
LQREIREKRTGKGEGSHLFYPPHLSFLLICILLPFLASLVKAAHKTLDIAFMSKTVLVMLPRRSVVRNVNVAVFAEITLFGDPIFAHDRRRKRCFAD